MGISNHANGNFTRMSKGPLYTKRELKLTEMRLENEGFTLAEESKVLGCRTYTRVDGACAAVYLDSLNCNPMSSGIMFMTFKANEQTGQQDKAITTSVWDYAKGAYKNPIVGFIRRLI